MVPRAFRYHRASSLVHAASLLSELGGEARVLAGGQSLIPLMKLRLSSPAHLVDIGFIRELSFVKQENGSLYIGAMTRHSYIESSAAASTIPILHDCAAGIADAQVRSMGTLGGSLAEADPTGDWAPVLLTLGASVVAFTPQGERTIPLATFIRDAFTTVLAHNELLREVVVSIPHARSGGAYIAHKRCAPVYASAGVAVQLTMSDTTTCQNAAIALGAVGLTPIAVAEVGSILNGKQLGEREIKNAADAAAAAADPQDDMRGSADYKRQLVRALTQEALHVALRRSRSEKVEIAHHYA